MSDNNTDTIRFIDYFQTALNAGTYTITTSLDAPLNIIDKTVEAEVKIHVAGPRYFLSPQEIQSVYPPENGEGDYNNVLPHVILNRQTLPWERLISPKKENDPEQKNKAIEATPFLALLIFSEDEENVGDVTPPFTLSLGELGTQLEPGEKTTDKVSVIAVNRNLLKEIMPTQAELQLLAHAREQTDSTLSESQQTQRQQAIVIANRLPAPPSPFGIIPDTETSEQGVVIQEILPGSPADISQLQPGDIITQIDSTEIRTVFDLYKIINSLEGDRELKVKRIPGNEEPPEIILKAIAHEPLKKRNIAHLVMLEDQYAWNNKSPDWAFNRAPNDQTPVQLVCLKSWQFTCSTDKPTLKGRLLGEGFSFEPFCVPKGHNSNKTFERIRTLSYAALPYHLRWGDQAPTLYHGPLVANAAIVNEEPGSEPQVPASAEGLVRLLHFNPDEAPEEKQYIFDVSLAAAWQLGRVLLLRDQSIAMEYFGWRRRNAQLQAMTKNWQKDKHLHLGDKLAPNIPLPKAVQSWFQDHLALQGLPFEYLVPDARMLPEHSLRFFKIHNLWMRSFVSGAIALGRSGEADRQLEAKYVSKFYPQFDDHCTGFLLRTPAIEEHPGLEVKALGENEISLVEIRLERIAPGVLLGLYQGEISTLRFSLSPMGLHFGLKEPDDTHSFAKDLKSGGNTKNEEKGHPIPMRKLNRALGGAVIDVSKLSRQIKDKLMLKDEITSGNFAYQMCEGVERVKFSISQ